MTPQEIRDAVAAYPELQALIDGPGDYHAVAAALSDIQPNTTTQAAERHDILNVGGFSDAVFTTVASFASGELDAGHWVGEIEKISLAVQ